MQKELIAEVEALQKKMEAVKNNAACWKAARKLQSAREILATEWVDAPPATADQTAPEAPKAAKK